MKFSSFVSLAFLSSNVAIAFILNWVVLWIGYFHDLDQKVCPNTTIKSLEEPIRKEADISMIKDGSSVWCYGSHVTNRTCQFKYLCYYPEYNDYIFLHGPKSHIEGINFSTDRFTPAVSDMSSVENHNDRYFTFLDLPITSLVYFTNVTLLEGKSLIFQRFYPDNIMHVFHDDLLPLFQTLQRITQGHVNDSFDTRLVFMEGWNTGPYFNLYQLFSNLKIILRKNLVSDDRKSLICFQDAHVGVSKTSTWYQYGFEKFQGPLDNIVVSGKEIRQFTTYVKTKLKISNSNNSEKQTKKYIILLSRSQNRLIINEVDLSIAIAMEFGMQVIRMSLETHSFKQLIEMITGAEALIGMHGSALILSMFLSPGALLVELFPFGINPDHYTPYQTLAHLSCMRIVYKAWHNTEEQNTVPHPDRSPELGGIQHLPLDQQEMIQNAKEVPQHFCCKNPHWLYRIFQDTTVDIPSLLSTIHAAFKEQKLHKNTSAQDNKSRYFPGEILHLTCQYSSGTPDMNNTNIFIKLSWEPPWNLNLIGGEDILYEVWIQKKDSESYMAYILSQTSYIFTENLQTKTEYVVWVRCTVDGKIGPFVSNDNCK